MKFTIYKVEHKGQVIYVGRTKNLRKRTNNGWKKIPYPKSELNISVLEVTEDVSRERYWIQYYRDLGCILFNIKNGDGLDRNENTRKWLRENPTYQKEYYEENKETILQKAKEFYKENKEERLEINRRWLDSHPEYQKEYYEENKERLLNNMKIYQERNKEEQKKYRREYYRAYRERKKLEKTHKI